MKMIVVMMTLLCSGMIEAQGPPSATTWIPLMVENSNHQGVKALNQDSLIIKYDKSQINNFQVVNAANFPLHLGILIDVSGSERGRDFAGLFAAAKDFTLTALHGPSDRVFFLTFSDVLAATGWLTREQASLVAGPQKSGGGTALYDAIVAACKERMGQVDWSQPTRRVLILISDGEDDASRVRRDAVTKEAAGSGAIVFALSTPSDYPTGPFIIPAGPAPIGEEVMQALAVATGGKFFPDVNEKNLARILSGVSQLMNQMYFIGITMPSGRDKIDDVEVRYTGVEKVEMFYPHTRRRH